MPDFRTEEYPLTDSLKNGKLDRAVAQTAAYRILKFMDHFE